jgi:PAS domain S-box-containing protein
MTVAGEPDDRSFIPEERRVILLPTPLDGGITGQALAAAGIDGMVCPDLDALCDEMLRGVGVTLLTEESIAYDGIQRLFTLLADQPLWSDLPVILLSRAGVDARLADAVLVSLGNVTLLERPVRLATLMNTLRSGLRARARQVQLREYRHARTEVAASLWTPPHRLDLGRVRTPGRTPSDRAGAPTGSSGAAVDSIARPGADAAPPRTEALGEALLFGAWECDPFGRVSHLAPAFLQLLGRDLPTCRAQGWVDLVHPDDHDRFVGTWPRLFANPAVFDHEYRIRDGAGAYHTVLMRGMPLLNEAGVVTAWVGINLDITEKRREERELERVDRLESVSLVAGGIAHDFNNLLTAILGNIALARMTAHRDEEIVRRLQDAERAGKQAQELARQLLTFARGTAPVRAPVWIPGLLRNAAEFALQGLGVRCEFHLADNLPGVQADAAQLGQVVQNLVLSGATAMGGEGVLVIRASAIEIGAAGGLPFEPGPYVMVSVTDRGKGIAPADLLHVFDLPHTSETRSGLALPIAHAIIRRHGGHLLAASQPEGSTFTFYLPAGAPIAHPPVRAPAPQPNRRGPVPSRGRGRLMVMDDDAQVRAVAYLSLVRLGYQVTLAMHGFQAIEIYRAAMAESQPYQMVFLDLTVQGGMGGRETLQHLHDIDPTVRAIAVTGYTDDPLLTTFAANGFVGAITKPYTVDDLSRVLQATASRDDGGQVFPLA